MLEAICKDLDKICTGLVPTADGADGHTIRELEKDLLPLVEGYIRRPKGQRPPQKAEDRSADTKKHVESQRYSEIREAVGLL